MGLIPIRWREQLYPVSGYLVETLDGFSAGFEALFTTEHNSDGTHANVAASAVKIDGDTVSAITTYDATLADVDNSTTPTNIISFHVGGNKMSDGDQLDIRMPVKLRQNSGAGATYTAKMYWGTTSVTLSSAVSVNDNAGEGERIIGFTMVRERGNLFIFSPAAAVNNPGSGDGWDDDSYDVMTPDFTVRSLVAYEVTLSTAHANFYIRPDIATVQHFRPLM